MCIEKLKQTRDIEKKLVVTRGEKGGRRTR